METKEMVLTIKQMSHLKELGLEVKDTALCWVRVNDERSIVMPYSLYTESSSAIPALNLQEILEGVLPSQIEVGSSHLQYVLNLNIAYHCIEYVRDIRDNLWREFFHGNILQAAYKMLCWVLESGFLKTK